MGRCEGEGRKRVVGKFHVAIFFDSLRNRKNLVMN